MRDSDIDALSADGAQNRWPDDEEGLSYRIGTPDRTEPAAEALIAEIMGVEGALDLAVERLRKVTLTLQGMALQASAPSPAAEPATTADMTPEERRAYKRGYEAAKKEDPRSVLRAAAEGSEPLVDEISLVDLGSGWYRFTASANTQDVAAIGRAAAAFAPREVSDPDLSEGWDPTAGAG